MKAFIYDANPGLRRRFPLDEAFISQDFSGRELKKILDQKLKNMGVQITEDGRDIAMRMLELAKQQPNFGNGGEVDNILSRAIVNFRSRVSQIDAKSLPQYSKDAILTGLDFKLNSSRSSHAGDEVDHLFQDLIGLDTQIEVFRRLARQVKSTIERNIDPKKYVLSNFVLKGPPGCGKTFLARKIGSLYYQMGLLATDEVVEVSAQDIIANHIRETDPSARRLLKKALGKVLLIDEAYRLTEDKLTSSPLDHEFASEVIDELMFALLKPEFVGKVVIILAGYESHIDSIFKENPRLARTFRTHIRLPALSSEDCIQLLKKKIEDARVLPAFHQREPDVRHIFESLCVSAGWGNGRDVEAIAADVVRRVFENPTSGNEFVADEEMILRVLQEWQHQFGIPVSLFIDEECVNLENMSTSQLPAKCSEAAHASMGEGLRDESSDDDDDKNDVVAVEIGLENMAPAVGSETRIMAKGPPKVIIRSIEPTCIEDGCGNRPLGLRAPEKVANTSSAAFNAYMGYVPSSKKPAMQQYYESIALDAFENLKAHEALARSDGSVPWCLHETGVFVPWIPGQYPRIKKLCKRKCCTHKFLEPLAREELGRVGCATTELWMANHANCTAKADSIRVGKKSTQGIRLTDILLRMGYLLALNKRAKVAALVKRCIGKTLILTPNLDMCTQNLIGLLNLLQEKFLTEVMRGRGPKFSLPTSVEHDVVEIPGVGRHAICTHSDSRNDFLRGSCTCVPRGTLKPKRIIKSTSRYDTAEDYETYAAVSYVWRECGPEEVHRLLEDQGLKQAICGEVALCEDGHENVIRRKLDGVWIDQQCINQEDPKEKAEEISKMRAYYQNANLVFVILPSMVLSNPLVGFTRDCLLDFRSEELEMEKLSDQWDKQMWRTRVWTYQEGTANIKTIAVCNNGHIQLSILEAIILEWRSGVRYFKGSIWETRCSNFLGNMASLLSASDFELSSVTRELVMGRPGLYGRHLRDIIPVMRNRDYSLALDRIYGVLGLACDGNKVKVDYNMTEEELMLHLGREGLLSIETLLATTINDTPGYSWIPKSIKDLPRPKNRLGSSALMLRLNKDEGCKFMATEKVLSRRRDGIDCIQGCIWYGIEGAHEEECKTQCELSVLQCFYILMLTRKDKTDGDKVEEWTEIPGYFFVPGRMTAPRRWQRTGPALWENELTMKQMKRYLPKLEHWIVG